MRRCWTRRSHGTWSATICRGGTPEPGAAESRTLARLTERERQVLSLIADGRSNQEIAAVLVIAESTAKTHVKRILAKIDARDRAQAVVFAYRSGLVRQNGDR